MLQVRLQHQRLVMKNAQVGYSRSAVPIFPPELDLQSVH
jgi:hypothetical protein